MKRIVLAGTFITAGTLLFANGARQSDKPLWDTLARLKADYEWVDLSFEVSPQTPHWWGFDALSVQEKYTFEGTFKDFGENENNSFLSYVYTLPGQYGTHTDFPKHFDPSGRAADSYVAKELAYPLVVIDKSGAVAANFDYILSKQDVLAFEAQHGAIPAGAFVVFRSDWSKRPRDDFEATDAEGNAHYPGWGIDAIKYLVNDRKVAGIGHETPDTDPAVVGNSDDGMIGENYVLDQGRLNVELLRNLDRLPPTGAIIFITFPIVKDGTGFTSRVFAITGK
jgi:kynurenine formamidase